MRNFSFIIFFFCCVLGNAQGINIFNPATNVNYPAQQYFCAGENFNLKVDAVATSTGDYGVKRLMPSGYPFTSGGANITFPATGSNKFSDAFPIGFTFSFYGKDYTKLVAGSNGRLVFTNDPALDNLKDNNTYIDRTFSGVAGYSTLPSTDYNKVYKTPPTQELNLAQIFLGYTDLIPKSSNPSVNYLYKTVNVAGKTALLVTFQNMIRSNGLGGFSSVSYNANVLLIDGGEIVIYVNNKTEDTYNAILGIQNDTASKFKVPPHSTSGANYNNGKWKSEGLAMVFTPNQTLTPQYKWFRNATPLPETSSTLNNFVPNDGDVLKVEVSYLEDPTIIETDQITFTNLPTPIASVKSATCSQSVLETPLLPNMTYEWFQTGNPAVLSTTNQVTVSATGSYFVRMKHASSSTCFKDSAPISVSFSNPFPPYNNSPKYICKTDGSTSYTVDLYDYFPANPSQYSLIFQENGVNVPNYSAFPIAQNTTRTISIIAQNTAGTCTFNDTLTLVFASLPLPGTAYSPDKTCSPMTNYTVSDFKTKFFPTLTFDILFSTDGINYTLNAVNPAVNPSVFVKIKHPNFACETTGTVNFSTYPTVSANTPTTQLPPQCANATETFDLASLIPEINNDPNVTVTFHNSLPEANSGANAVAYNFRGGIGSTTLYIRVVNNVTGCVSPNHPSINLVVYYKPSVLVSTPIVKSNCLGNSIFNLTQNPATLTNATPPVTVTLEYYSANGTQLFGSQITNFIASVPVQNPYIKVIYNATCSDIIPFNLGYFPAPASLTNQILICSETNYPLQDFKNKVAANPALYTFTDLSGNPLPTNFNLSVLPLTVNFLMKDIANGCVSTPQSVTFVQGGSSSILTTQTDYFLCDADYDGKTEFELDSKKAIFTTDPSAKFEYFKDANLTQSINQKYINETAFAQPIYVRITIPTFCPSVAIINLKVNSPTNIQLSATTALCYNENLNFSISNFSVFSMVKLISPEGTETMITTDSYTIDYADVQFGKTYKIRAENSLGCVSEISFTPSDENQPKIDIINQTNNSIEVIASGGTKPYRYYFNGVPQTSNILQNPTAASYEIQVESATGCFGPPKTIYFIKINNAFTPNADGINDTWKIDNLDKMESVNLVIIDRNGTKVFESTNPAKTEWDGRANGRELSTASYWYIVSWFDAITQITEQRQGWILLKNRN